MLSYIYNLATDKEKGLLAAIIKLFLYLTSLIYGLVVRTLIFIYRINPCRLNCKVISVGNITLGGTGKTSLVLLIARHLKESGHKVAILSRGYKRKAVSPGTIGDEPYMLKANLKDIPVLVGADRVCSAKQAIADYGVDTVILDDGMQQWRIKKDLEIVTIDATAAFGNGNLIPRGILREPLTSLKRADMFVLTKINLAAGKQVTQEFLKSVNPKSLIVESAHLPLNFCRVDKPEGNGLAPFGQSHKQDEILNLNIFRGKTVALFSGIGEPDSFESLIKSLGITVESHFKFRDHHNYTRVDLDNIAASARDKNIDIVITTEKDAARIRDLNFSIDGLRILYLRIELKITKNEEEFGNRLLGLYTH
jgi:tetraacyldisaccharide 4'-kinase